LNLRASVYPGSAKCNRYSLGDLPDLKESGTAKLQTESKGVWLVLPTGYGFGPGLETGLHTSFVSQRHHRVHAGSEPSRNKSRQHGNHKHHESRPNDGQRNGGAQSIQAGWKSDGWQPGRRAGQWRFRWRPSTEFRPTPARPRFRRERRAPCARQFHLSAATRRSKG
jgi:hypothetical protein